jgi:hypothetical protein
MKRPWLVAVLFVALVQVAVGLNAPVPLWDSFVDGDSYLRLMRTARFLETGAWHDDFIPRANAPFGFVTHWTRPFDIALGLVAAPLIPFLGVREAVHVAGIAFSPLMHLSTVLALAWAARPLLGSVGAALAGGLTILQVGEVKLGGFGVADHHFLFILLTVLVFGLALRSLEDPGGGRRPAVAAGLLAALGFWLGTEMLVFLALVMGVASLAWVAGGKNGELDRAKALSGAFLVGIALALALDRGWSGLGTEEYDRVSIVHLAMAALLALAWWGLGAAGSRTPTPGRRLLAGVAAAGGAAACLLAFFPKMAKGPEADIPSLMFEIINQIDEYRPISEAGLLIAILGPSLVALPMALRLLKEEWGRPKFPGWLLATLALAAYAVLTQRWPRWAPYAGLFACLPLAAIVLRLDGWMETALKGPVRLPAKAGAFLLVLVGPLLAGALLVPDRPPREKAGACATARLVDLLNGPVLGRTSLNILTAANMGPELIYRTPHEVVATVHHRNPGLLESLLLLRATDMEAARAEFRRRAIGLVVLCPGDSGNHYERRGDKEKPDLLYRRLLDGRGPAWLKEMDFPPDMRASFRLFAVVPSE